jgi:hypothetical protein
VIHVKSKSDLEAGEYSVKLMTLYDSNQRQSYIRDEIAKKHVLRYVQVPERTVDISPATTAKTTKLFILDVKPRSSAKGVGPEILTAYGVEGMGADTARRTWSERAEEQVWKETGPVDQLQRGAARGRSGCCCWPG